LRILFIGDVVGKSGREYLKYVLRNKGEAWDADLIIANGENSYTNGRGINREAAESLYDGGVELITLGNHTWDQKEVSKLLEEDDRMMRPANFPEGTPGKGFQICRVNGVSVLVINVMGRAFLSQLDCPFRTVEAILQKNSDIRHVVVDMHAETTSEKLAMSWYFDGRVSLVVGTHTHVQTSDERILPKGTACITDVGMVGPRDGILGMDRSAVIRRMYTYLPSRFEVADGLRQFSAVLVDIDDIDGLATEIQRISIYEENSIVARTRNR